MRFFYVYTMEIQSLYTIFLKYPSICTDTRKITKNCLFFALKGENFNGNKFAKDAIKKGAKFAIIDEKSYPLNNNYILVDDVLKTLQQLANYHSKKLNIPIIGITGTNGKTTTKELINTVLAKKYKTTATKGNLNNHIGVPLTLLSIKPDCEIAIIEMGANHLKEIEFLCKIAEPNYGIITNIGTAHIEGFGSLEGVKKTKNELYQFIKSVKGKIFVNADDKTLNSLSTNSPKYTYGNANADCIGQLISSTPVVKLKWKDKIITSKLYGNYNYNNILAAICIGNYFDVAPTQIQNAIENYTPKNNRSQLIKMNTNTIFLDAYNANPTSMNAAIDTFAADTSKNKLMILGDMLELGNISQQEHQAIVTKVEKLKINTLFIGNEFSAVPKKYNFTYLKDYKAAKDWLKHAKLLNYHLLIKGSRGIQLENIIAFL